jgi:2-oxoglutarate ferredoxin oxidoreductase subunit delta
MRSKRHSTQYIHADTSKCEACWECIPECKYDTLGKLDFWFHKHVVIKNPENCRGCRACIAACPNGVFRPVIKETVKGVRGSSRA